MSSRRIVIAGVSVNIIKRYCLSLQLSHKILLDIIPKTYFWILLVYLQKY